MRLRHWRILLGRLSVIMINTIIGRTLLRIGRERIKLDFRRRDLNHPHIIIPRRVLSLFIQAKVCTNKIFNLRVEIGQQSRKEKK
jgi:hypothetical protein